MTAIAFPIFMVHGPSQELGTRMLQAPVYQIRPPKRRMFSSPYLLRGSKNLVPRREREGMLISFPKTRSDGGQSQLPPPYFIPNLGEIEVRGDQTPSPRRGPMCAVSALPRLLARSIERANHGMLKARKPA